MKIKTTIAAIALTAIALTSAQADVFRVSFYLATENGYVGRDGRLAIDYAIDEPDQHFRYTDTTSKTECAAYCRLIKKYPDAREVDVIRIDD